MTLYVDRISDEELSSLTEFAKKYRSAALMTIKRLIDAHMQSCAYESYTNDDFVEWQKDLTSLWTIFRISKNILE